MLISKALIFGTIAFAFFSVYALFYSLYQTQLKFDDTSDLNPLTQGNHTTWFKPKVKVVMVIIDALRFDYLLSYKSDLNDPALRNHKLREFNKAFYAKPDRFVVLRANADAPTMTVLRVPCLMTGNVPRLGSVLTAFGAIPSIEDSVPRQLYRQKRKSYFSGDPILKEYFPKYLKSDYKRGAFNIGDRTVDQPVQAYINRKLAEKSYDFLAAHMLRLDHMGHQSRDLRNSEVLAALNDIDRFLVHIMNVIDDNTMLIFAGDHGMTKGGDHGGDSKSERQTAIVAYCKKGFKKYRQDNQNKGMKKIMRSVNETAEQIQQIDLVPTLSMLMGLPIPFSNMGQILNDLYPKGDYFNVHSGCPVTTTFDASFEMQLVNDNYLNTLQVWNYFKKYHAGQKLYTEEEFANVTRLFEETDALFKAAQDLIKQSKQCEDAFHKAAIKAILNSQKLANDIHVLVNTKIPRDLIIFWQAFLLLVLVGITYILLVQHSYKNKDPKHITWNWSWIKPKNWKAKILIPVLVFLTILWAGMLATSPFVMRPLTSTVLTLAVYLIGSLIFSLFSKPKHEISFNAINTNDEEEEKEGEITVVEEKSPLPLVPVSPKSFFILQNPFISAGALAIIGLLFYLTDVIELNKFMVDSYAIYTPACFALLAGVRFAAKYLKFSPFLIASPFIFAIVNDFFHIELWKEKNLILMGLLLVADWVWSEMQFARNKLKAGRIWSYQYVICFAALVAYHYYYDPRTELVKILLPRGIWAVVILNSLAGFALRMPKPVIKRNIQVYFVLFLTLMQLHRKLLCFGIVLSLMRVLTFVFKRTQFKNYLYPILMGFISYFGLFSIGFHDQKLPRNFEPAFVGIREFHLELCLFLYGSAMMSTIILGVLFMSFYSQDIELQEVELGNEKEKPSDCQIVALKGHSSVIKKRNVLLFSFFFCALMLGAAINPVALKSHKKVYLSLERFLVDAAFYLFAISIVHFIG